MKNKKKRLLSVISAVMLTAGLLAGCGNSSASTAVSNTPDTSDTSGESDTSGSTEEFDISETVNLVMYVVSDRPAGQDLVDQAFNELLMERLNCTLTINWISWADVFNKYPLLFSSGEEFDMAYCSTWLNYSSMAQKGAFLALDDLWETYAPNNYAATSEVAFAQSKVNGSYYCIPTRLATYRGWGPIYRTDLMEGYDWDGVMETWEDVEEYLDIIVANYPEMEGLDLYSSGSELDACYMWSIGYMSANGASNDFLFFDPTEESPQLFTYYECEEIGDFLDMMNRWNEKGFFGKSVLSDTNTTKFTTGKAAVKFYNLDGLPDYAVQHPDWGVSYANLVKYMYHLPYTQDCMVLSNTASNPERALMLWDLITSDQEVFDAFYYGILGTTYELNDAGQYTILDTDNYTTSAMWAARTDGLYRDAAGTPDSYNEWKETFEQMIAEDDTSEKYASFILDTTSIETEYAACQNVHQQYWWPLELGYTDAESGLVEYQEQMEAAGIEVVREEFQRQLDEYVAGLSE